MTDQRPQLSPLYVPISSRNMKIDVRVFTKRLLGSLIALFDAVATELAKKEAEYSVERLYEYRKGDDSYSGPIYDEYQAKYEVDMSPDFLRIVVGLRNQVSPNDPRPVAHVQLVLDKQGASYLEVVGRDKSWANGVYARFQKVIETAPTGHGVLYAPWFETIVRLGGMLLATALAIFAAKKAAESGLQPFGEVYIFVVAFVVLVSIWQFIYFHLDLLRAKLYPRVDIREEARKPIIAAIIGSGFSLGAGWLVKTALDLLFLAK